MSEKVFTNLSKDCFWPDWFSRLNFNERTSISSRSFIWSSMSRIFLLFPSIFSSSSECRKFFSSIESRINGFIAFLPDLLSILFRFTRASPRRWRSRFTSRSVPLQWFKFSKTTKKLKPSKMEHVCFFSELNHVALVLKICKLTNWFFCIFIFWASCPSNAVEFSLPVVRNHFLNVPDILFAVFHFFFYFFCTLKLKSLFPKKWHFANFLLTRGGYKII